MVPHMLNRQVVDAPIKNCKIRGTAMFSIATLAEEYSQLCRMNTYYFVGKCPAVSGDRQDCGSDEIPTTSKARSLNVKFCKIIAFDTIHGKAV